MEHKFYLCCRWATDVENASLQYYNGNTILFNEITLLTVVIFKTPFFFFKPRNFIFPFFFFGFIKILRASIFVFCVKYLEILKEGL